MFKKISLLMVVFLLSIFLTIPSAGAVLSWDPMVNGTLTGNRAPGFGDNNNILAMSVVTFDNYVYVSNYNGTTGTEVWRSADGTTWEQANTDGFGTGTNSYAILAVFGDHLYAFNWNLADSYIDVFRYSSGTAWTDLANIGDGQNPMNNPLVTAIYGNALYVEAYRTNNGTSAIFNSTDGSTWTNLNQDGFGDANNETIMSLAAYNNLLYAGTYNDATGTEVWRYDGVSWTQDNTDGFGDADNISTGALTSFNGSLYASTTNGATGAEVWKFTVGGAWTKVSDAGFGQGSSANTSYSGVVFKDRMYLGIGATIAKVFRTTDGSTYEQVNVDGFGYADNQVTMFTVLGDYLYAGTGLIPVIERQGGPNTTEVYRYYEASAVSLPQTGRDTPLNAYILDALM